MIPTFTFYLLAILPFVYGGIMFALNKRIHWIEWIGSAALCFLLAGAFHLIGLVGQTADKETWSGEVTRVVFYPRWVEEYQQMHTRTVTNSNGSTSTEIYWTTEYRTHHENWRAETNINEEYRITKDFYHDIARKFGDKIETVRVYKSGFYSGDHNIYPANNHTRWIQPVTKLVYFENKIKATPSAFAFSKVPKDMKGLYDYPGNSDPFKSDRLIGTALATIDQLAFDQMNSRLGPSKKVNVIMVGMGDADSMLGEWQKSKWVGGKKNDVVILWGGNNKKPEWVKCFGWSKSETCKRNLETIVLENGAVDAVLPLIEKEIRAGYEKLEWKKTFVHISVPAPMWALWSHLIFMAVTQIALWWWFHANEYDKNYNRYGYRR